MDDVVKNCLVCVFVIDSLSHIFTYANIVGGVLWYVLPVLYVRT